MDEKDSPPKPGKRVRIASQPMIEGKKIQYTTHIAVNRCSSYDVLGQLSTMLSLLLPHVFTV